MDVAKVKENINRALGVADLLAKFTPSLVDDLAIALLKRVVELPEFDDLLSRASTQQLLERR